MTKNRIIAAIDFSSESELATKVALNIARCNDAELLLVHIAGQLVPAHVEMQQAWLDVVQERDEKSSAALDTMVAKLSQPGDKITKMLVSHDGSADGLAKVAGYEDVSLVVVGTHGRTGIGRFIVGSVAETTVRRCPCNVMVVRPDGESVGGFKRILVPTDFSEHAEAALKEAIALAAPGAKIDLVHYYQLPNTGVATMDYSAPLFTGIEDELARYAEKTGKVLTEKYAQEGVQLSFSTKQAGAADGIVDAAGAADVHYDAIVMGSHGLRGFRRLVIGSVAERVVRHAPCTVLVVHLPGSDHGEGPK